MDTKKLKIARQKRKGKVRKKLLSRSTFPRLVVIRSNQQISAQVIERDKGNVLCSATSKTLKTKEKTTKTEQAKLVGQEIGQKIKKAQIKALVLDRGRYQYAGRIKALVEAVKEAGVKI